MQKAKLEKEGIIPRKPFRIPETLTSDEQKRLLKQPNRHYPTGERNLAMLHLMLSMGLRLSEAVNLRWQDVDLLTGKLKVVQANSRLVSLNRCPSILSLRSERKGVRPSFLGFHRFIERLCGHTDARVQELYEVSCLLGCIVMNSHNLIESLVTGCLIGGAGGKSCLLVSGFSVAHLDVSLAFCRTSGRLIFVAV